MGTRHLIAVMHNGKYIVGQYGQWDGYPSGQGIDLLKFLKEEFNKELLLEKCKLGYLPTDEEIHHEYIILGSTRNDGYVDYEISKKFDSLHPTFCRDAGAKILSLIQNAADKFWLKVSVDFAKESLFCEWCYVIDLDKNTFEVYKGFNKSPILRNERFYFDGYFEERNGYHPVKLLKEYSLDKLPTEEEFLKDLEKSDDEGD